MPDHTLDFSKYTGVRARMQRMADAKCCNVWVASVDDILAVVEAESVAEFAIGQRFQVQVSGLDSTITFHAELKRIVGKRLRLTVISPVKLGPAHEDARVRQALEGLMWIDGKERVVFVEDVSASGLGILATRQAPLWKRTVVTVQTARGPVQVEGQVRYCREIEHERWTHRIGLFAPDMETVLPFFGIK